MMIEPDDAALDAKWSLPQDLVRWCERPESPLHGLAWDHESVLYAATIWREAQKIGVSLDKLLPTEDEPDTYHLAVATVEDSVLVEAALSAAAASDLARRLRIELRAVAGESDTPPDEQIGVDEMESIAIVRRVAGIPDEEEAAGFVVVEINQSRVTLNLSMDRAQAWAEQLEDAVKLAPTP